VLVSTRTQEPPNRGDGETERRRLIRQTRGRPRESVVTHRLCRCTAVGRWQELEGEVNRPGCKVEEGRGRAVDWRQWWWAGGRKDRAVDGSCHEFATQSICWCNVQWNRLVLERSSGAGLIAWIRNRRRRVWNSAENRMVEGRVLHTRVQEWSVRKVISGSGNRSDPRPNRGRLLCMAVSPLSRSVIIKIG
jgi:hypothetical protein